MKKLSKDEMKKVIGGSMDSGSQELCLGCTTDKECKQVNKGTCKHYPNCNGGVHCCTGWTSCS